MRISLQPQRLRDSTWPGRQQTIQDEANRKRSEAQKNIPKAEKERKPTSSGRTSATAKAAASGTNRGAVERMDRLDANRPDPAEQVRDGELTATAAIRKMNKYEIPERVAALPSYTGAGRWGRGARLGRQHADQEGFAGLADDFGLALTNESMGSDQFLIAQTVEEHPGARVDPAPHVLHGKFVIARHGLACHIV